MNTNNTLSEVIIKGKKSKVFRDKYIGKLDSITKSEITSDYVCVAGFLNCPVHQADKESKKPVEGEIYKEYLVFENGTFVTGKAPEDGQGYKVRTLPPYRYPKFTEAQLMHRLNITKVKGFYPRKEFYSPNYEEFDDPYPDYRNNLIWSPNIITDKNGEATVSFYCSDINTQFIGIIEGVSANGLLGLENFEFFVKTRKSVK